MKIQPPIVQPDVLAFHPSEQQSHDNLALSPGAESRELTAAGQGARQRAFATWEKSRLRQDAHASIAELIQELLSLPDNAEKPVLNQAIWRTVLDVDTQRCAANDGAPVPGSPALEHMASHAGQTRHPRHADAALLQQVLTRPIGAGTPALKAFLARLVTKQIQATIGKDFDTAPICDFTSREGVLTFVRTFNGIMQGAALNSQDYASLGRTLMFAGAKHLADELALQDVDADRIAKAAGDDSPLAARLQLALFCFPTSPAGASHPLTLQDFDPDIDYSTGEMAPDPLERLCEKDGALGIYADPKDYPLPPAAGAIISS